MGRRTRLRTEPGDAYSPRISETFGPFGADVASGTKSRRRAGTDHWPGSTTMTPMKGRTLVLIALVTLGLPAAYVLWLGLRSVAFPYPLDYGEGPLLDQALRLAHGQNIYRIPGADPPWTISNYPPLYPLIESAASRVFGPAYWYGRAVSLLSAVGAAAVAGLIVHRCRLRFFCTGGLGRRHAGRWLRGRRRQFGEGRDHRLAGAFDGIGERWNRIRICLVCYRATGAMPSQQGVGANQQVVVGCVVDLVVCGHGKPGRLLRLLAHVVRAYFVAAVAVELEAFARCFAVLIVPRHDFNEPLEGTEARRKLSTQVDQHFIVWQVERCMVHDDRRHACEFVVRSTVRDEAGSGRAPQQATEFQAGLGIAAVSQHTQAAAVCLGAQYAAVRSLSSTWK